ncbi:flagellar basal body L-ring protein FlgH [Sphingomonas morindae]|uniref:Flagellar L-ring protein n=1 Tax=Sphingomonas morindae TaxID=1541170 RepID=A0ABY4X502_9SPHN|nr:flagellar basal body L-ring protein FlgH [Sphingomonas morindae]USI71979.1 flagellar basal body L-ring protein FlgH [Sphingomonas morindae]
MPGFALPLLLALLGLGLSGCGVVGRVKAIGRAPAVSPSVTPQTPAVEPSLGAQPLGERYTGGNPAAPGGASLFRTGAGAFFHDQRASARGDILTVRIQIADSATLGNSSSRGRTGAENAGLSGFFGLQTKLQQILPGSPDPAALVAGKTSSTSTGTGNTSRTEEIKTSVAAIVKAVLPNGNLVIEGRQEIRVNFELRELLITGIVRPQDIARDNSIRSDQIAEARISYGGRGQLTDMQQPRWGQQLYEAVSPF